MSDPVIRINPDLPLCWEDPRTLRVGFEYPRARIYDPSAATQRFVAALRSGVHTGQVRKTARRLGTTPFERKQALKALKPVLQKSVSGAHPHHMVGVNARLSVRFCDNGRPVGTAIDAFERSGFCAVAGSTEDLQPCDFAVVVERFFEPLERAQRWLSRGTPHLLLRFTDESVHVGPIVSESGSPCLSCLALGSVADDPAIPALSAQLVGRQPSAENAVSTELAAALALGLVQHWLAGNTAVHSIQLRFTVRRGVVTSLPTSRVIDPHPDCACAQLAEVISPPGRLHQ